MRTKIREQVYSKYGGRCAYCGEKIDIRDMQVDHFVPLMRGYDEQHHPCKGTDNIDNLMPSCRACNYRKGMGTIEDFRRGIGHGLVCCRRDFTYRMMVRYRLVTETPHTIKFYFEEHNAAMDNKED